jgi:hypothetical protein
MPDFSTDTDWVTDRLPTRNDADVRGQVTIYVDPPRDSIYVGVACNYEAVVPGQPWMAGTGRAVSLKYLEPTPPPSYQQALHLAADVATAARHLVGGTAVFGWSYKPADINNVGPLSKALRTAVDAYDQYIVNMSRNSTEP